MNYKEFYIWLEGFMTNRDWTVIKEIDIDIIIEKMKEVKDEKDSTLSELISKYRNTNPPVLPIRPRKDDDELGYPPKIVM